MSTASSQPRAGAVDRLAAPPIAQGPLLRGLVDDAALFPPGNAPMHEAVPAHEQYRRTWFRDVVGPFLCPASRIGELQAMLPASAPQALRVAVLGDAGGPTALADAAEVVRRDPRLALAHLESALPSGPDPGGTLDSLLGQLPDVPLFVEVPRAGADDALRAVATASTRRADLSAKFRTGGVSAEAVPGARELAAVLRLTVDLDLSLKLTAGLHRALRHDVADGWAEHGFLNVLVAFRRALLGDEIDELADVLDERRPAPLLDEADRMSEPDAMVVRSFFVSFGCCGVPDVVDDLLRLGLVRDPHSGRG